jgi:hypothetical protein
LVTETTSRQRTGHDDSARALLWCCLAAIVLVVIRSFAMLAYERLDFDSDQAIVGLMAKHLSELRTFPLFFYGQDYMLGVQAWIAVPFFWLGGPTVAMLRAPLVVINCLVAVWLVRQIARSTGSPWLALAAVLPFAAATPVFAANLLETLGASVEPFLYVLLLWTLRRRPVAFGVMLAIGFLHREFTIFAVAGIGMATYRETGRSQLADLRWVTRAALGFAAVWIAVDQLKRRINTMGPPGGAEATGPLILQLQTLLSRVVISPAMAVPKLRQAVTEVLPDLLGMRAVQPLRYNINAAVIVGTAVVGSLLAVAGAICLIRLAAYLLSRRGNTPRSATLPSPFCTYMAVIGVQALLAYSLSDAVDPRFPAILRYALLAVFLPIALVTAFFEVETRRTWRAVVAILLAASAALNTRDSWRIIDEYRRTPMPSEHRILADDLVARHVEYGTATYFDAYITDFFARERVVLHSRDKVRIAAYAALVDAHAGTAVRVVRQPCGIGRPVASSWCVVDPLGR